MTDPTTPHILIVEDDPAHAEAIMRAFKAAGTKAEIQVAGSLREYSEIIKRCPPDIVITDMKLPDGKGLEVLTLSPITRSFPVVVMTSFGDERIAAESIKAGALEYVVKSPEAFSAMPRTVEGALREWNLIQKQKRLEETLREIMEHSHDVSYKRNLITGVYDYLSLNIFKLSGYTKDELMHMPMETFMGFIHPDDMDGMNSVIAESAAEADDKAYQMEYRFKHKAGHYLWCQDQFSIVRDVNGQPVSIVGSVRDISERKSHEEEKARLESQLRQAQKMESVGRLAGGVAHDFNNKLTAIMGNLDMAIMDIPKDDPLNELLLDARKSSESSASLIRQLLAFSRKQFATPKLVDVNEMVSQTLRMIKPTIGENILFNTIMGKDGAKVTIDPGQFEQVLVNLLINARDAMPKGGTITTETLHVTLDDATCMHYQESMPGEYVGLKVSDTGTGMTKDVMGHLFEPFFTTKDTSRGAGLGLSSAFGIIRQNNGFIGVESVPEKGSTFTVLLPKAKSVIEG